jgi:phosphonate degradation associated HDIG domain protein
MQIRTAIEDIYAGRAQRRYGLSSVNQLQHALQAAALAEQDGEPASLIVAALLHDIGHMIHDLAEDPAAEGIDDSHEARGAAWLAAAFGPEVVEPVRLHVPAKRYLCATEADYFDRLSSDSVRSLALQGGPMSADEVSAFNRLPYAAEAVRLRRIDDLAKDKEAVTQSLAHYLTYVDALLVQAPAVAV